jgi:hypothetical protein
MSMQMPIFQGVMYAHPLEQPVCQRSTGMYLLAAVCRQWLDLSAFGLGFPGLPGRGRARGGMAGSPEINHKTPLFKAFLTPDPPRQPPCFWWRGGGRGSECHFPFGGNPTPPGCQFLFASSRLCARLPIRISRQAFSDGGVAGRCVCRCAFSAAAEMEALSLYCGSSSADESV